MSRPLILLSNDDGFEASGIRSMRDALREFADVIICAPATEQSATSHAITLNRALNLREAELGIFVVDGTPADCVYVALHAGTRVLPARPSLVVAGLNHGLNLGNDVFYSGTVAAAREGALRGVSAIAVSASNTADRASACRVATRIAQGLLALETEETVLLNVNFPPGSSWRTRVTQLGNRVYQDGVMLRTDLNGGEQLWIGSGGVKHSGPAGSDTEAFDQGVVGVTPLSLQLWAAQHELLAMAILRRSEV